VHRYDEHLGIRELRRRGPSAVGTQPASASFAGDANYLASYRSRQRLGVHRDVPEPERARAGDRAACRARHSDRDELKDVIRELTAALAPSLWTTAPVDSRRGDQGVREAPGRGRHAMDLQRQGSLSDSALQGIIDTVVHADRVLAEVAVADAIAAGSTRPSATTRRHGRTRSTR
jgi:hypothetical protein